MDRPQVIKRHLNRSGITTRTICGSFVPVDLLPHGFIAVAELHTDLVAQALLFDRDFSDPPLGQLLIRHRRQSVKARSPYKNPSPHKMKRGFQQTFTCL